MPEYARSKLAVASLGLTLLIAAAPPRDRCAAAKEATGYACESTAGGVALAADAAAAARLAAHATAGEERWRRYFGGDVAPYAVVESLAPPMTAKLHAVGFPVILPWLSAAQFTAASTDSVRRATETQLRARGITDPAQITSALDQAAAQTKRPGMDWSKKEAGAVPHELGHMWYIARFWPGARIDGASHYGGPGPDWMDETAAVLVEDDGMAQDRRHQFDTYYRDPTPAGTEARRDLLDLETFLHREHPAKAIQQVAAAVATKSTGPRVLVLSPEEAKGVAQTALRFYLQARVFADYLIARSGNPVIFADIGAAFGRGESIEQWLAARGKRQHLPATVAALRADWVSWIEAGQGSRTNATQSPVRG